MQKVQIKAARFIEGKGWSRKSSKSHRQTLLNDLKWPNVKPIISSSILNLTKRAIDKKSSKGLNDLFKTSYPVNPRKSKAGRINHKGPIKRSKNTLSGHATELYNALPERLKIEDLTVTQFKTQLKAFMKNENLLIEH